MLEILRGKINGEGAFGFEGSGTPEACLLLDSETPPTVFANRLEQMGLAGEIQNRFFPISKRDPKAAYPWDCFNILNEDHRKALEHLMDQHHIGNFTLDNLTSVCAPGKLYSPQSAGIVLDWAGTLTRQGVGVLLLHHTLEGSERGRGTEEWGIRCTTEIMLIGRKQILKSKQYPAVVGEHARRKGFTAGLYFKSCKAAPSLEENILWFHCPLNGTEFTLIEKTAADGSEILEDEVSVNDTLLSTEINEEPGVESVEDVESILSLIPEEHLPALEAMKPAERDEVLKVLEMAQHRHEGFTVKNAKGWLECADTKAQDRLKVLMDFGLLDRLGQASSTRYKIRAR